MSAPPKGVGPKGQAYMRELFERGAVNQVNRVTELLAWVTDGRMPEAQAEAELDQLMAQVRAKQLGERVKVEQAAPPPPAPAPLAPPPMPVPAPAPLAPPPMPVASKKGPKPSEHQRDLIQSAGIDLAEESQTLLSTLGVAGSVVKNPYREDSAEPKFCAKPAIQELIKRMASSNKVAVAPELDELLCLAVEMRMMQVLRRVAEAARAAEDEGRHGTLYGPVHVTSTPQVEVLAANAREETAHAKKAKQEQDVVAALLAEGNTTDARVKNLIDEQARQRAAAASSEAALQMARATTGGTKRTAAAASMDYPPEVRIAKAKVAEGAARSEDTKMIEDWDRRSAAVQRGQHLVQKARSGGEKRVGVKELLFVLDSDPFFRSQKLLSTLKSGFVGRGVVGEKKWLL